MIIIKNDADFASLAEFQFSDDIKALMLERKSLLDPDLPFSQQAQFVVVTAGGTLGAAGDTEKLKNWLTDGKPDSTPCWEWVIDHDSFYEAVWILSDDGYGIVLFVDKTAMTPALEAMLQVGSF